MGVLGNLDQYTRFQTAEAIRDAAQNPGGIAGLGAGVGAGVAIGQQMAGAAAASTQAPAATTGGMPPPLPGGAKYHVAINGQSAGPFELPMIAQKIREGAVARSSLVWKPGMTNWVAAESVPDVAALFADSPPPLPK
jgi:hypothetical protein